MTLPMWSLTRIFYAYVYMQQLLRNLIYLLAEITRSHQVRITLTLPPSFFWIPWPPDLQSMQKMKESYSWESRRLLLSRAWLEQCASG